MFHFSLQWATIYSKIHNLLNMTMMQQILGPYPTRFKLYHSQGGLIPRRLHFLHNSDMIHSKLYNVKFIICLTQHMMRTKPC